MLRSRQIFSWVLLLLIVMIGGQAFARREYGPHAGYISSVEKERDSEIRELVLPPPPVDIRRDFSARIFNEKLTREFRDRYEEKFGRTEAEQVYNAPNRFTYFADIYGFTGTPQEMDNEKRSYGDFVIRRLVEYHVDNYAQNDPKLRPAWEAKERIKEFKVEVAQFRFDAQYSIAGNTFDVRMINPYLDLLQVRLQMDAGRFGPAPVQETTFSLGRRLTRTISAEAHYRTVDGTVNIVERKAVSPRLGFALSQSTYVASTGETPRESKYLAGLTYIF